jgi:hypothetical protein
MASDAPNHSPPEPRRFSIWLPRPLWIGVAAVVLALAGVGARFGLPLLRKQLAVTAMEQAGVRVTTVKGGPDWLRRWAGDERMRPFDEVRGAEFLDDEFTDGDLALLRATPELDFLSISSAEVTDAGLHHVAELRLLESLSLYRTQVSDAGLVCLRQLPRLQWLELGRAGVTSAGLEHLKGLTGLRELTLCDTPVGDDGLKHLSGLTNLRRLDLRHTNVTDSGLRHLCGLTNLEALDLSHTQVGDIGIAHLMTLKNLRILRLDETEVTSIGAFKVNMELPNRPLDSFVPKFVKDPSNPFLIRKALPSRKMQP